MLKKIIIFFKYLLVNNEDLSELAYEYLIYKDLPQAYALSLRMLRHDLMSPAKTKEEKKEIRKSIIKILH